MTAHDQPWREYLASTIGSVLVVAQLILFIIWGTGDVGWLTYVGFVLWWVGVIFAWVPIFQFKRQGGVAKGESYIRTTVLVDTGFYAIVRHPQFIAWPMFTVALMLLSQHWVVVALGVLSFPLLCVDFHKVDARNIEKFGDAYVEYAARVPGWNPVEGLWRLLRRGTRQR